MSDFRQYLFPPDHPRLAEVRGMDPYAYREHARTPGTFTGGLVEGWTPLYRQPFRGITEDGVLRGDLYPLEPARPGEEAPVAAMVTAAEALLAAADDPRLQYPVDSSEWQTWANPEFLQFDTGLRLEFQPAEVRQAALALVAASLSSAGFAQVQLMMRINGFLGEVVGLPTVLGEFSYNLALYGEPDLRAPWGWQLYGHHCAVNCLVVEGRMVVSPVFLGAEPDAIDEGPHTSPRAFAGRIAEWRAVMAAMTPGQRSAATVYAEMVDPAMPPGRVHPGDERHLDGAFQDNRVIPVEGVRVADLPAAAQDAARAVAATAVGLLPDGPWAARLREIDEHWADTTFSWIGGHGPDDVFYARLQSPVVIAELDHHCGVFLDYRTPQPFHVHTVLRTPHGNDYGRAWVRRIQERS